MAETEKRRIDVVLTGQDQGASAAMTKVGQAAKTMAQNVASAQTTAASGGGGAVAGPAVRPRFDAEAQAIRDKAAGRIRAMRDAAARARIDEGADAILNGPRSATKAGPDLNGADFGRGQFRSGGTLSRMKDGPGGLQALNQQSESLGKLLKLGGAVGLAAALGQKLQQLPEVADEFRASLKSGSTKSEAYASALAATIPGIGDLAKGFRALYDTLTESASDRKKREDKQAQSDNVAQREKRDESRRPFFEAADAAGLNAKYRRRVSGLEGPKRESAQIQADLDRELDEIKKQRKRFDGMGDDPSAVNARKQLDQQAAAAQEEAADKRRAMDKQSRLKDRADLEQYKGWELDAAQDVQAKREQVRKADLEQNGQYLTARLVEIKAATDREIADLARKRDEERKAFEADAMTGRAASVIGDNPDARFNRRAAAARAAQAAQERAEREQERREVEKAETDHAGKVADIQASLAAKRLRDVKKDAEADRLEIQRGLAKQLEDIKANADEQLHQHAERGPQIRRQAAELARLAAEDARVSMDEVADREAQERMRFRPAGASMLTGDLRRMSGLIGATAVGGEKEKLNQQVKLTERTAKAGEAAKASLDSIKTDIATLAKALGVNAMVFKVVDIDK
jgi:hypothetical protein